MSLIVVGTNHKYSSIDLRERISFSKKRLKDTLIFLKEQTGLKGIVILSTCNRVEIYASCNEAGYGISCIEDFLSIYHEIDKERLTPYLYRYTDKEAIEHLFNVSCGLDSQIIGESQIMEQIKSAYDETKRQKATDELLDKVFNKAIETGIMVRNKTKISEEDISIGSISVELIKKQFGTLKDKKILIIGVGKISELVLKYLRKEEVKAVFIANRSYERALELVRYIDAEVVRFDRLKEKLKEADIIISATSSPHLILKKKDILEAINYKLSTVNYQPLLIIDLAVPRDVDPNVKYIKGVSLFCLDGLDFILEKNLERRRQEIPKVLKIIEQEVENLWNEPFYELEPERVLLR